MSVQLLQLFAVPKRVGRFKMTTNIPSPSPSILPLHSDHRALPSPLRAMALVATQNQELLQPVLQSVAELNGLMAT